MLVELFVKASRGRLSAVAGCEMVDVFLVPTRRFDVRSYTVFLGFVATLLSARWACSMELSKMMLSLSARFTPSTEFSFSASMGVSLSAVLEAIAFVTVFCLWKESVGVVGDGLSTVMEGSG